MNYRAECAFMHFNHPMTRHAYFVAVQQQNRILGREGSNYNFAELLSDRPGFIFKRVLASGHFGAIGLRFKDAAEPSNGVSVRINFYERVAQTMSRNPIKPEPCKLLRRSTDRVLDLDRDVREVIERFMRVPDTFIAESSEDFCVSLGAQMVDPLSTFRL